MKKSIVIENEAVHLKKDFTGWRVIYPCKNDNGTWNWKNLLVGGSYWNIIKVIVIVVLLLFLIFSYLNDVSSCRHLLECGAKCPEEIISYLNKP
jgi:hypothetical protein